MIVRHVGHNMDLDGRLTRLGVSEFGPVGTASKDAASCLLNFRIGTPTLEHRTTQENILPMLRMI
jgi:hypothetical protein